MTQDEINQVRALVTDYRGVVNDPVLRAQCDEVFGWLTEELNKTAASLGTPASQTLYIANRNGPSDDPQKRIHSGDTFRGKSHVDPFFFQDVASNTGANRQNAERHLLAAFLHEVAHMYNKDHGEAETMAQYLSHDYFKAIESMVPGVACVRRS